MAAPSKTPPQHPILGLFAIALVAGLWWFIFHTRAPAIMSAADKDLAWESAMKDAVRTKLKDPDTAIFRNTATHHSMGIPVVCGEVNAKNSFGGMRGFQRFIAAGDSITLEDQMRTSTDMTIAWGKACQ